MKLRREFEKYRVFVLDGDGVLWRGETPISSAVEAAKALIRIGKVIVLVTNNSTVSRAGYRRRLSSLGIDLPLSRIYSSGYGAARHVSSKGYREAYVVGESGLVEELRLAGVSASEDAECVVAGMDRGFDYSKLARASDLVRAGAYFVATNRDATLPVKGGQIPGAGAIVAAIEVAAGRRADVTIGKPEPFLFEMVLEDLDAERDEVLAIGDRLDTDILGAHNAGIDSALVLTGIATLRDVEKSAVRPDYILKDLSELFVE